MDYENNTEPGFEAPGAVFSGQGNFTGEKKVFFSILPPAVRSVNMSSKDKGISVSWNSAAGADGYELLISPDKEFSGNVVTVSTDECAASLTNGFTLGTEYHCKVRAYILKGDAGDRLYGDFSEVCSTKVYGGISKVTVSEDYYVYDGNPHSPKAAVYDNDGSLLNEGRDYTLKMPQETVPGRYAVTAEGINSYHGQATAFYDILPVCNKIISLESTDNNIIVSWEKDALADGYMIIYSQSADFNSYHTFTQGNTDKTSANLVTYPKAGQTWYVKVCSFIYTDASHTGWRGFYSQPQSIEVKGTVRTFTQTKTVSPGKLSGGYRLFITYLFSANEHIIGHAVFLGNVFGVGRALRLCQSHLEGALAFICFHYQRGSSGKAAFACKLTGVLSKLVHMGIVYRPHSFG